MHAPCAFYGHLTGRSPSAEGCLLLGGEIQSANPKLRRQGGLKSRLDFNHPER